MNDQDFAGSTLLLTESDDDTAVGGCLDVIAGSGRRRDVLVVTFGPPADTILHAWRTSVSGRPANLGLVAVGNASRSSAKSVGLDGCPARNVVRGVPDPADHETIMEAIVAFLEEWDTSESDPVVYVESVDSLVRSVGVEAANAFVEDVTAMLEAYDCPTYVRAIADDTADTVRRMETVFDRVRPVRDGESDVTSNPRHGTEDGGRLPVDDVFELLSAKRRRLVLHVLVQEETPMPVASLAKHVARLEAGAVEHDSERRTYVALQHVHLPKLEAGGVVAVDGDRNVVDTLPDGLARVEPALSLAAEEDLDDSRA